MKTFSAPAKDNLPALEIARGCFTTNLAIPGLGSVMGGRKIGYLQMLICFTAQIITLVCGIRFISWALQHWSLIFHPDTDDPLVALRTMWFHLRWPLLGIILYAVAFFWALLTGWSMLVAAKKKDSAT